MKPIVFLHIPKTAGQSVHAALQELVGGSAYVSPVRVHTQAADGAQMPPGYALYSGHLDWAELDSLPSDRFAFTILRDPRERIASFYFYLRAEAERLSSTELARPENLGKRMVLERSADDYFFGGDEQWQAFIRDHYDNFYVSYLATRKVRGRKLLEAKSKNESIQLALAGAEKLQGVYTTSDLSFLEADLSVRYQTRFKISNKRINTGQHKINESRWTKLVKHFEIDKTLARLEKFLEMDLEFLSFAQKMYWFRVRTH